LVTVRIKCYLKGKTYQQFFTSNFVTAEDVKEANWDQVISQDGLIAAEYAQPVHPILIFIMN